MKGLMELLSKPTEGQEVPGPVGEETAPTGDFASSAEQCMDALQSGDSQAFAEALKACIQMAD